MIKAYGSKEECYEGDEFHRMIMIVNHCQHTREQVMKENPWSIVRIHRLTMEISPELFKSDSKSGIPARECKVSMLLEIKPL